MQILLFSNFTDGDISCVPGNPFPNITWYKNGQTPPERQLGGISMARWALTLEDLITQDSGNYTCKVCNIMGCIEFTFTLDVIGNYYSFIHKNEDSY